MEKEKVTEELVRQNGNQAAAVMADYAGQGGGGGGSTSGGKVVYGSLVDLIDLPCFKPINEWPAQQDKPRLSDVLADGYTFVRRVNVGNDSTYTYLFIVKVAGSNPSVSVNDGLPDFTDCEPVILDLPAWTVPEYIEAIHSIVLDDISDANPIIVNLAAGGLPANPFFDGFKNVPFIVGKVEGEDGNLRVCVGTFVRIESEAN